MLRRVSSLTTGHSTGAGCATATALRNVSWENGFFSKIPLAPPDMILGLSRDFARDADPKKVNLAVGVYRDDQGKPFVLESVKKASAKIPMNNMDYAPITGIPSFVESAERICYGDVLYKENKDRLAGMQSLSGTGALRMAAEFMKRFGIETIHVPSPTYPNHAGIFRDAGVQMKSYPYYSLEKHELELGSMLDYLESLPEESVVLLHACAHNPTGFDPTPEQWEVIGDMLAQRKHIPFVDMAYQGFATSDLERDGYVPRMLLRRQFPAFFTAQSFAKNFGLYGQRAGALHIACGNSKERGHILSQMSTLARAMYSNPPIYGAQLVDTIVRDPELSALWAQELSTMAHRMASIRQKLFNALTERGVTRPLHQIREGHGMMALSGMTAEEVKELREKHHVFMVSNGRIAFSGLTDANLNYVADAMTEIMNRKK